MSYTDTDGGAEPIESQKGISNGGNKDSFFKSEILRAVKQIM